MVDVEIRDLSPQSTLVVRRRVELAQIGGFIQEALGAVFGLLAERGVAPVGMPFVRYLEMSEAAVDVEAGTAVASATAGKGIVATGELPGGPCAVAWHIGPFETIAQTYEALMAWIAEQRRVPGGPPWECYWTDPAQEPDPSKWRTEVFQPLVPA